MALFLTNCTPAPSSQDEEQAVEALNPDPLQINLVQDQQLNHVVHTKMTALSIRLEPAQPLVEQTFSVVLKLPQGLKPERGRIVGVSMYMGAIPVLWEHHINQWHAEVILGACSDPNMRWRLEVPVSDGETTATLRADFRTQQP